jgi:hypothetical protein
MQGFCGARKSGCSQSSDSRPLPDISLVGSHLDASEAFTHTLIFLSIVSLLASIVITKYSCITGLLGESPAVMSGKPAWYDAYPPPRNTSPSGIDRKDLLALLQSGKRPGKDLLLVDLRRTDHEVRKALFPGNSVAYY